MAGRAPDHRIKLHRAEKHLYSLDRSIKGLLDFEPYELGSEFDAESGYYIFRLKSHEDPTPEVGAIIGDILFNLRSALDHLAYALNLKGGPLSDPTKSGFPIAKSSRDFTVQIPNAIPNIGSAAQAVIESFQPYHGSLNTSLGQLNELCNADKHRLLHVVNVVYSRAEFYMGGFNDPDAFDVPSIRFTHGALKDGAEILRVRPGKLGVVPKPEMHVKLNLDCEVAFDQAPAAGSPVWNTLNALRWFVGEKVFPALELFL